VRETLEKRDRLRGELALARLLCRPAHEPFLGRAGRERAARERLRELVLVSGHRNVTPTVDAHPGQKKHRTVRAILFFGTPATARTRRTFHPFARAFAIAVRSVFALIVIDSSEWTSHRIVKLLSCVITVFL